MLENNIENPTQSYVKSTLKDVFPNIDWSTYFKSEQKEKFEKDLEDLVKPVNSKQ